MCHTHSRDAFIPRLASPLLPENNETLHSLDDNNHDMIWLYTEYHTNHMCTISHYIYTTLTQTMATTLLLTPHKEYYDNTMEQSLILTITGHGGHEYQLGSTQGAFAAVTWLINRLKLGHEKKMKSCTPLTFDEQPVKLSNFTAIIKGLARVRQD